MESPLDLNTSVFQHLTRLLCYLWRTLSAWPFHCGTLGPESHFYTHCDTEPGAAPGPRQRLRRRNPRPPVLTCQRGPQAPDACRDPTGPRTRDPRARAVALNPLLAGPSVSMSSPQTSCGPGRWGPPRPAAASAPEGTRGPLLWSPRRPPPPHTLAPPPPWRGHRHPARVTCRPGVWVG